MGIGRERMERRKGCIERWEYEFWSAGRRELFSKLDDGDVIAE